ncbi:MAG: glycosyltransferase family 4 protein [Gemmatimonadales bacterium]|nr:glycosyltransferase family 4 protein [Gemmatimonadales bacterium]
MPAGKPPEALLCVVPYESNVGFAWSFIEGLYARLADRLAGQGIPTFVSYRRIDRPPTTLQGSSAAPIELDLERSSFGALWTILRELRRRRIRVLYLTDSASVTPRHWFFRLAGVRWIVVHDHTSGARTVPRGFRRALKWLAARVPGLAADRVLAVSDYVARRQREVVLLPERRLRRVWNGLPLPAEIHARDARTRLGLPLSPDIVVCVCRAAPEKGVETLFRAFDAVWRERPSSTPPLLIYVGDGPHLPALLACRETLQSKDAIQCVGYQRDVGAYLSAATVVAVPSIWEDALPLGVLEAMARARPVVASTVGGIPEMARDGREGVLVPAGNVEALRGALCALLDDPSGRERLGRAGRERVAESFRPEDQLEAIHESIAAGF